MRDSRSPGVAPEAGATGSDAAGTRRNRRTYGKRWRHHAAALKHVLRESRKAGAVAVDTHGARVWLNQPSPQLQRATQPAETADAEGQSETQLNARQRRSAARLRAYQERKRKESAGPQLEPQPLSQPETGGEEATNASVDAARRGSNDAIAMAGAAASSGSTAMVAAPHQAAAVHECAMETVARMEGVETSSGEPSESGELPLTELNMEQRAEVRQVKRAREPADVGIDPTWDVLRLKLETGAG